MNIFINVSDNKFIEAVANAIYDVVELGKAWGHIDDYGSIRSVKLVDDQVELAIRRINGDGSIGHHQGSFLVIGTEPTQVGEERFAKVGESDTGLFVYRTWMLHDDTILLHVRTNNNGYRYIDVYEKGKRDLSPR